MEPDIRTDPYRNNKDKIYVTATFPGHFGKSGKSENRLKKGTRRTGAYLCTNFFVIYLTIGYPQTNLVGILPTRCMAKSRSMQLALSIVLLFFHLPVPVASEQKSLKLRRQQKPRSTTTSNLSMS